MAKKKKKKKTAPQPQPALLPHQADLHAIRRASNILAEIAEWKLEAKSEDNRRYFYNTADVALLSSGARHFVIGRKGTGKTAIREHLLQSANGKRFADTLTFKNFPFNDLYAHTNSRYTQPNQYMTFWKWIIYCRIGKMMAMNMAINNNVRSDLARAFPTDTVSTLARSITRLTSPQFTISFLGMEMKASVGREREENTTAWIERCDVLEQLIAKYIDDSTYLLVFDELDEDYRDMDRIERRDDYVALMTSLFKAVQDIRSLFKAPRYHLYPIIFLRDDIYDLLRDSDKTKWNDSKLELTWTRDELRNMLAFRLTRAADPEATEYERRRAFALAFDDKSMNSLPGHSPLDFMHARSLQRPRDLISFCQIAAKIASQRGSDCITGKALATAADAYSQYLRGDIEDEMGGLFPDIKGVMDVLASIRLYSFTTARFKEAYERAVKAGKLKAADPEAVLELLFRFSVIGNDLGRQPEFRYRSATAEFNPTESITIHPGLLPTLRIVIGPGEVRDFAYRLKSLVADVVAEMGEPVDWAMSGISPDGRMQRIELKSSKGRKTFDYTIANEAFAKLDEEIKAVLREGLNAVSGTDATPPNSR